MAFKKDHIKFKKYKIHTICEDVKKLKYIMCKILTQIHLNYKFKKITFLKIFRFTDCLIA